MIAKPEEVLDIFCIVMGILLLAYGVIKIIGYFSRDFYCLAFQFDFAFGILLMAVGAIMLIRKNVVINLIYVMFGLLILTDALFKIQTAMDAKKFGLTLWWRILLIALCTGVFGFVLLVRPLEAAQAMMRLTGVSIILEGLLNLCVVIYTVKVLEDRSSHTIEGGF
ncbi:MAG: DUF308 domain-containing protein [Clostridiales bacterium]|nr:DUF308 domain-containing protein [Clostridiales bacterium]